MTRRNTTSRVNSGGPAKLLAGRTAFGRRLLQWYRRTRRDLPWRRTNDPYAIWVSEIMLQQTRVEAAIPYYERFLAQFPTVQALACAPAGAVLKAWEGLGYYSRARNLHRAAALVVRERAARLPRTAAELSGLPGIGRYTAAAIASIAFGEAAAVLDGNVARVLCRLAAVRDDPRQPAVRDSLWALAQALLPAKQAGDFNQAMMELGAIVCVPSAPRCDACPVAPVCAGREKGLQNLLPVRVPKKRLPHYTIVAAVIEKGGRILIDQRPPAGLLGGLWEFPGGKVAPGETHDQALRREVREEVGLAIRDIRPLAEVEHAYSHFRITLHAYRCRHAGGRARALACQAVRWVRPAELDRFAFPTANRRIIKELRPKTRR